MKEAMVEYDLDRIPSKHWPTAGVWVNVCDACRHAANAHRDSDGGGVYGCPCGCRITQDDPTTGLTERQAGAVRINEQRTEPRGSGSGS
jgi:hypothetical protein